MYKNKVNKSIEKIYFLFILFLYIFTITQIKRNIIEECIEKYGKSNNGKESIPSTNKCYVSSYNSNIKILHIIITRFLVKFSPNSKFNINFHKISYIQNGIRVLKKYLLYSLNAQTCKDFIWILMLGDDANITYVKSLLDLNNSFESLILYEKELKNYIKNKVYGSDILITTRIDYDDCIYYDAVNDVRKMININKPILIHGYNSGLFYPESTEKYYQYIYNNNNGVWGVFLSLILVLNKVNDNYNIYDLGNHCLLRQTLMKSYKTFGIMEINYEPIIIDYGDPKFIYVRQNYSHGLEDTNKWHIDSEKNIIFNFNITKFFGK